MMQRTQAEAWTGAIFVALYGETPEQVEATDAPAVAGEPRLGVWVPGAAWPLTLTLSIPGDPEEASRTGDWTRDPLVAQAIQRERAAVAIREALGGRFIVATASTGSAPSAGQWVAWRGSRRVIAAQDETWLLRAGPAPPLPGTAGMIGVALPSEVWGGTGIWSCGSGKQLNAVYIAADGAQTSADLRLEGDAATMTLRAGPTATLRPRAWFSARAGALNGAAVALTMAVEGVVSLGVPGDSRGHAAWVTHGGQMGIRVTPVGVGREDAAPPDERTVALDRAAFLAQIRDK